MTSHLDRMDEDLGRQIRSKLWRWISDSFDLYEMAELPSEWACSRIFTALLNALARGCVRFEVPPDMAVDALRSLMEIYQRRRDERAAAGEDDDDD
jgi:hypothetical protein